MYPQYHFGRLVAEWAGASDQRPALAPQQVSTAPDQRAKAATAAAISREARSNQRRILTVLGTATESELLKFNQLKVSGRPADAWRGRGGGGALPVGEVVLGILREFQC